MESITVTGKTVDEAIEKGLEELGVKKNNISIDVIKKASNGFLGFGSKMAEVKLMVNKDPLEFMQDFLIDMLKKMGLKGEVNAFIKDNNILYLEVWGSNMGILIGKRGQTLNSIQYILNIVLHKEFKNIEARLIVDVEGYRSRREETLQRLAKNLANRVISSKEDVVLEPMTPLERRIIHTTLQDNPDVSTHSEGEGSNRYVVITLK